MMMEHWIVPSIVGIPAFLIYFIVGMTLIVVFGAIFVRLTPHHEIELIRAGNVAAAVAFGGSLIGFALPLSRAIQQASSIPDLAVWAGVSLIVQFAGYHVTNWVIPRVSDRVAAGDMAAAVLLAAVSIAAGLVNAASMTV